MKPFPWLRANLKMINDLFGKENVVTSTVTDFNPPDKVIFDTKFGVTRPGLDLDFDNFVIREGSALCGRGSVLKSYIEESLNECDFYVFSVIDYADLVRERYVKNVMRRSLLAFATLKVGQDHLYIDLICTKGASRINSRAANGLRRKFGIQGSIPSLSPKAVGSKLFDMIKKLSVGMRKKSILLRALPSAIGVYETWGFQRVDTLRSNMEFVPRTTGYYDPLGKMKLSSLHKKYDNKIPQLDPRTILTSNLFVRLPTNSPPARNEVSGDYMVYSHTKLPYGIPKKQRSVKRPLSLVIRSSVPKKKPRVTV